MCIENFSLGRHLLTPIVTSLPWNLSPTVIALPPRFTSVTHCRPTEARTHIYASTHNPNSTLLNKRQSWIWWCLPGAAADTQRENRERAKENQIGLLLSLYRHIFKCGYSVWDPDPWRDSRDSALAQQRLKVGTFSSLFLSILWRETLFLDAAVLSRASSVTQRWDNQHGILWLFFFHHHHNNNNAL